MNTMEVTLEVVKYWGAALDHIQEMYRMGRNPAMSINLGPKGTPAMSMGVHKDLEYIDEWKSWMKKARPRPYVKHVLWDRCCVCKNKTRANMPWWKPAIFIKAYSSYTTKDISFYYETFVSSSDCKIWGVCSKECLNMFYLGNDNEK